LLIFSNDSYLSLSNTDRKKDELFAKVRKGEVRVLLGSTEKMGSGTNVQKRLIALHHLDCPWRPTDITQREGRGKRQGNDNPLIQIYRYVTERSFDSYSWQIVENKQRFLDQLNHFDGVPRTIEDVDVVALNYAEVKALATGDTRIIRMAEVDAEVTRLETLERQYRFTRYRLEDNIKKKYPADMADTQKKLDTLQTDRAFRDQHKSGEFSITLNGRTYTERKEAGEVMQTLITNAPAGEDIQLGSYQGFPIHLYVESTIKLISGKTFEVKNYHMNLRRGLTYPFEYSGDPVGLIERIENPIFKMDKHIETFQKQIAGYTEQIVAFQKEYDKAFAYKDQLMALKVEQQELTLALNLDKKEEAIVADAEDVETEAPVVDDLEDEDEMEMD